MSVLLGILVNNCVTPQLDDILHIQLKLLMGYSSFSVLQSIYICICILSSWQPGLVVSL